MEKVRYLASGDSAISIEFGNIIDPEINKRIRAFQQALKQAAVEGIVETVPTYRSVLVVYRPERVRFDELTDRFDEVLKQAEKIELAPPEVVELPVLYGGEAGPDLETVAEHCGLTPQEVIRIHSSRDYLIYMLGFIAGFPYLGGMDERIAAPRLSEPRVRIEGGSVGIAGNQTGVYPVASPGGWQLIGRTPVKLYDADREKPVLLEAGQYVRFRPVDEAEYRRIEEENGSASDRGSEAEAATGVDSRPGLRVVSGGFLTTVQDMGRYGYQETGMAVSGVMDTCSATLANLLVGNPENEAVLEITMMGPALEFTRDNIIALTGGDLGAELDHEPLPRYQAVLVRAGQAVSFAGLRSGSRAYLAFAGGLDIAPVMGSRSTNLKAKLGGFKGRKLAAGDEIGFAAPKTALPNMNSRKISYNELREILQPGAGGTPERDPEGICTLRVVMGPQDDCFTEQGIRTFLNSVYTVSNECDRMGCRMEGDPIEHKNGADIITDGISFGAVQVPAHGRPIVMMADHQTTGGYTKIACVISADLPVLAQCRPGSKVRFRKVTVGEAQELLCARRERMDLLRGELDRQEPGETKTYRVTVNGKEYMVEVACRRE